MKSRRRAQTNQLFGNNNRAMYVTTILILLFFVLLKFLHRKLSKHYNYWTEKGVSQRKQIYFLGDSSEVIFRRKSFFDVMLDVYNSFPEARYIGIYQTTLKSLVIRDLELIKQITIKDFDHFIDHQPFLPDEADPLWTNNVFSLKGDQWRQMRNILSPTFTSGKMKMMFNLILDCTEEYCKYFDTNDVKTIELKDMFTRLTNDIIASIAFGIKCDSINNKTNQFYEMGQTMMASKFWSGFAFFGYKLVPGLFKLFKIKIVPDSVKEFFVKAIADTIESREKRGNVRLDMVHLLLEARKSKNMEDFEITDLDITAQSLVFFFGGYDTVSTLLCCMAYELVVNPEVQVKLQKEIDGITEELTYDTLMKMRYLDAVVSETLRKWPTSVGADRICTKTYEIRPQNPNEKIVTLHPGDVVWFPINGIHMDPKYHPYPEEFKPERFLEDNIQPYTYFPFGLGPRNCIGSRLALLEAKIIFYNFLLHFDFVKNEKFSPLELSKSTVLLSPKNSLLIDVKQRKINRT